MITAVAAAALQAQALVRLEEERDVSALVDGALPIAGLFVAVLLGAVFLLWLSMRRQLNRINPELPKGRDDLEQEADARLTEEAVERGERAADESPGS